MLFLRNLLSLVPCLLPIIWECQIRAAVRNPTTDLEWLSGGIVVDTVCPKNWCEKVIELKHFCNLFNDEHDILCKTNILFFNIIVN